VGNGRKELTPDPLIDFATVWGIPADTLSVLTGVDLPEATPPSDPAAADVAGLLWEARRLTLDQIRRVGDTARAMPRA
jgi:antitoxin component HigA of HigAB toxin-antitoxin module